MSLHMLLVTARMHCQPVIMKMFIIKTKDKTDLQSTARPKSQSRKSKQQWLMSF